MTDVRLTLSGLSREDAEQIGNALLAEWNRADPRYTGMTVSVITGEDAARERRDADLLYRLRQVHLDLSEATP
jgi:hypothetical protein